LVCKKTLFTLLFCTHYSGTPADRNIPVA